MIYLHIPFCQRRCIYCDFYSTTQTADIRKKFVHALCDELKVRKNYICPEYIPSIYFGGGTPSQLSLPEIEEIMNCIRSTYKVNPHAEITFEANPDDITPDLVKGLRSLGFNRISLGVQTFNDELLQILHRRHTAQEARDAVETICNNGIDNISIDLMYGLPKQSFDTFKNDLNEAFKLPIKHLSSYALSVEEGTAMYRKIESGELNPIDEEIFLSEYEALMDAAYAAGFVHYEISNFALPGYHSKHNSAYWDGTPYLGCGPGAHSFDGKNRWYNLPDLKSYLNKDGLPPHEVEVLTDTEHFNELVFTSLRTHAGLDLNRVREIYGEKYLKYLQRAAQPHLDNHRLEMVNGFLKLTRQGIFVSNDVMSDLMME